MIRDIDFSGEKLSELIGIENGEIFLNCDFTQTEDTEILIGITDVTFIKCKLDRVIIPDDANIVRYYFYNFSGKKFLELKEVEDGEIFMNCNFARHILGNLVIPAKNIILWDCNESNCILSADVKIKGKRYGTNKSKCKHLHPEIAELDWCRDNNPLSPQFGEIIENCEHVIDSDEIYVDGVLKDIIYYYKDTII